MSLSDGTCRQHRRSRAECRSYYFGQQGLQKPVILKILTILIGPAGGCGSLGELCGGYQTICICSPRRNVGWEGSDWSFSSLGTPHRTPCGATRTEVINDLDLVRSSFRWNRKVPHRVPILRHVTQSGGHRDTSHDSQERTLKDTLGSGRCHFSFSRQPSSSEY